MTAPDPPDFLLPGAGVFSLNKSPFRVEGEMSVRERGPACFP